VICQEHQQTTTKRSTGGVMPSQGFQRLFMSLNRNVDISKLGYGQGVHFTPPVFGLSHSILILKLASFCLTKFGALKLMAFMPTLGENGYG